MSSEVSRRDQNFVPTMSGVASDDIDVVELVRIDPITKEMLVKPALQGLQIPDFDFVQATYPDAVTEVYTFKTGGSGGVEVAIVTVVYTDATKALINTVTKT